VGAIPAGRGMTMTQEESRKERKMKDERMRDA